MGYIQIYTGNGKGKTTASLGLMIRHLGHGGKVLYTQFTKGDKEKFPSGEKFFFQQIKNVYKDQFTFINFGSKEKWEFPENITFNDKKQAIKDWKFIKENYNNYTLLVIDEAGHAFKCGLLSQKKILKFLKEKSQEIEIVLTGRNFPEEIKKIADLISEINPIKHYYNSGLKARKGIEF